MQKVETCHDWCHKDMLDGIFLKDGERIKVLWGNGKITYENIIVLSSIDSHSSHGSVDKIETSKSYIEVNVSGTAFKVGLAESDLLCER